MDLTRFAERAEPLRILGVKVSQHGELRAQQLWDDECRRNVYSASKSFTSCAVGIAEREGLLSLQERLVDAFADDLPAHPDEHLQQATVRDLLTMCLGQAQGSLMGAQRPLYEEDDWARLALASHSPTRRARGFATTTSGRIWRACWCSAAAGATWSAT